jgi:hypothetical protein
MLTQQPKGQLQSEHERKKKRDKCKVQKRGNLHHLSNDDGDENNNNNNKNHIK